MHSYVWHDSFICVTWLIHMCDMTHSYVWHDSFICVTWCIHMCDMLCSHVRYEPFIRVTWPIHMFDFSHSYAWRVWFMCVTWRIHMCDMPHHMCGMMHSHVWHGSFIYASFATPTLLTYYWRVKRKAPRTIARRNEACVSRAPKKLNET